MVLLLDASDIGGKSLDLSGDSTNNNALFYFSKSVFVFTSRASKASGRQEGIVCELVATQRMQLLLTISVAYRQ